MQLLHSVPRAQHQDLDPRLQQTEQRQALQRDVAMRSDVPLEDGAGQHGAGPDHHAAADAEPAAAVALDEGAVGALGLQHRHPRPLVHLVVRRRQAVLAARRPCDGPRTRSAQPPQHRRRRHGSAAPGSGARPRRAPPCGRRRRCRRAPAPRAGSGPWGARGGGARAAGPCPAPPEATGTCGARSVRPEPGWRDAGGARGGLGGRRGPAPRRGVGVPRGRPRAGLRGVPGAAGGPAGAGSARGGLWLRLRSKSETGSVGKGKRAAPPRTGERGAPLRPGVPQPRAAGDTTERPRRSCGCRRAEVPSDVVAAVTALGGPGVLAVRGCRQTAAGLEVQLRRCEAFQRLLGPPPGPGPAPLPGPQAAVVLHCPALRCPGGLTPRRLRPVLLADHLAQLLRAQGISTFQVPAVADKRSREVLQQLRVEWPSGSTPSPETLSALKQSLSQCPYATCCERGSGVASPPEDIVYNVHLRSFVEQQGLEGYDPNLGVLLVTEEKLQSLAELQQAVLQGMAGCQGSCCSVVHVVSCEEEFQQQQMDLLWRILDPGARMDLQKHLVCGPVKVTNPLSPISANQYFQLRKQQMYEASVMKYGELAQDEAWTEVIDILTVAAIRFEMLSTAHRSQITLDLENSSISTKGTKSGAFVMYNCARLATLFDTYQRAVERGTYPPLPPASELNFSCLREEGEWLLLFSYLLPFPEVLQQAAQLPPPSKGLRITANTEAVCKFLIQLSMDFSSYYNRVHVLGEPFPHLFDQMFARLQLLGAVRDMFHSALATLHLPPLSQI